MNFKKYTLAMIMGAASLSAVAQNTQSGYFVEDYTYRFQMNPAYGNSKGFVSMPGLGNLNVSVAGNLHLTDILYNVNGQTTTFLNPNISVSEAMSGFSEKNRLGFGLKLGVLSFGFKGFHGYNTVSINVKTSLETHLPKSIFSLLKEGLSNREYSIENTRAHARAYAEIALGHSHDINSEWRVGATAKVLVGAGDISADLAQAKLNLGTDNWIVQSNGTINASVKGLTYDHKLNSDTGHEYVSGVDIDSPGVNGMGFAVDLGAIYKPSFLPDLTFSAAIIDLGFMKWKNNMLASTNGVQIFETNKYTFSVDDDAPNSFDNEKDRIKDDLSALYELNDMGDQGGRTTGIGTTFNIGAEYTFPYYRKLTFGLLNTTRIQGEYSWTDFRLSANVAPVKAFDASANIALGTYGFSFGWLANVHCPGFNLFLGMDHTVGKLSKQFVPLSSNAQFNLGLNFLF